MSAPKFDFSAPAAVVPEVPGLAYWTASAKKQPKLRPLSEVEAMYAYYDADRP